MGGSWNRATPSHHPFLVGSFHETIVNGVFHSKPSSYGGTPFMENPHMMIIQQVILPAVGYFSTEMGPRPSRQGSAPRFRWRRWSDSSPSPASRLSPATFWALFFGGFQENHPGDSIIQQKNHFPGESICKHFWRIIQQICCKAAKKEHRPINTDPKFTRFAPRHWRFPSTPCRWCNFARSPPRLACPVAHPPHQRRPWDNTCQLAASELQALWVCTLCILTTSIINYKL